MSATLSPAPRTAVTVGDRQFDSLNHVARHFNVKIHTLRRRVALTGSLDIAVGLRVPGGTDRTDPVYTARREAGFTDAEARAFPPYVKTRKPVRLYGVTFPDAELVLNHVDDATRADVTARIRSKDYDPPGFASSVAFFLYNWCATHLPYDER